MLAAISVTGLAARYLFDEGFEEARGVGHLMTRVGITHQRLWVELHIIEFCQLGKGEPVGCGPVTGVAEADLLAFAVKAGGAGEFEQRFGRDRLAAGGDELLAEVHGAGQGAGRAHRAGFGFAGELRGRAAVDQCDCVVAQRVFDLRGGDDQAFIDRRVEAGGDRGEPECSHCAHRCA